MEISNNYSTAKVWNTSNKNVSKSSKKNKWKLTDSLKEKIVDLAKKDAQDNVYMGNAFMNLRKTEVSKVAPNRAALIGKFSQSMNSGNMSAMKEVEEADKKWLCMLFGIKEVNPGFRVGGPAVCGGTDEKWIQAFMEYCHENHIPVDFVTRHHYTIDPPECIGHYAYSELMKAEDGFANLKTTRDIIDSFPEYKGLQIHITEFNSSYTPQGVIHDTNLNAAFIAQQLSRLGDVNESYSYWTFGDVFEELGVPFTPFHGGFGLVANGCITKPTFWTFAFYKKLEESEANCVYKDDNIVVLKRANGDYLGVAWNIARKSTEQGKEKMLLEFTFPAEQEEYCFLTKTVDEETCNPLKVWHDMGEPANLSEEQTKLIRESSRPFVKTERKKQEDGNICVELPVNENGVVYFELNAGKVNPDRGYDYDRVVSSGR